MSATVEQIARVCHEANKGWCEANGDTSQATWDDAADWQRASALVGVQTALDGATPAEQHQGWLAMKVADGWVYGEVKDAAAKTHPCLLPYDELPPEQKVKDSLFLAVVGALAG